MDDTPPWRGTDLADVTRRVAEAGMPAHYLDGYLEMLSEVVATGKELGPSDLQSRREVGVRAAQDGTSFSAVVDLYARTTLLAWRDLSTRWGVRRTIAIGLAAEAVFKATNDALVALADGYEGAQHHAIQQSDTARREFIDDLLYGRSDLGRIAERAQRFRIRLASAYTVAVARTREPFAAISPSTQRIEAALSERFGVNDLLVTVREGLLVCIAPSAMSDVPDELARQVRKVAATGRDWWVGVGRSHTGPGGVIHSYEEARGAIDLAERLDLGVAVVRATDLLVFQVLLRDRAAISDLVTTVLSPLQDARGGAKPLLATLAAYFAAGSVAAVARELNLSVRAVSYRLDRIARLTGYSVSDPYQRFTLETAVLGARVLDWPQQPLGQPV